MVVSPEALHAGPVNVKGKGVLKRPPPAAKPVDDPLTRAFEWHREHGSLREAPDKLLRQALAHVRGRRALLKRLLDDLKGRRRELRRKNGRELPPMSTRLGRQRKWLKRWALLIREAQAGKGGT